MCFVICRRRWRGCWRYHSSVEVAKDAGVITLVIWVEMVERIVQTRWSVTNDPGWVEL